MSRVRLLSPTINLTDEIVNIVLSNNTNSHDFTETVLVFPGKRPAHVVRKKISEQLQSAFLPPQIYSIDLFIEFLCTEHLQQQVLPLQELDAVAILFELHKKLHSTKRIGEDAFVSLENFYALGIKLYSELEELMMANVTPEQLQHALSGITVSATHALSSLYQPFYDELRKHKYATRAMRYQLVAEHLSALSLTRYTQIILSGFYAFTAVEKEIILHLHSLPNVTLLFQNGSGIRSTLEDLHLQCSPEGELTLPKMNFYEAPDAHGEIFSLNTVFQQHFPHAPEANDEAAIILPNAENLFPLYDQTLAEFDQQTYNIAIGYPLSRTPVYGFLLSLLDVIVTSKEGKVFIPKYLQFILHPYTKNILYKNRSDVTRTLIHSIEKELFKQRARVFISLEEIESDILPYAKIAEKMHREEMLLSEDEIREHCIFIHTMTLRALLQISSLGEFANKCVNVLQFINERSTAHRHPYFRPFLETLLDHLLQIEHSQIAKYPLSKPEYYFLFLQHYSTSAEVPFTGTPLQGLQVLGFLETRGLTFKKVFVLDTNDDVLPGKSQQDVLLPLTVREQLKLSTYREQEKIKAYIFDTLLHSAEEIHLFYINNHEKEPSRYIAQLQWNEQFKIKNLSQFNTKKLKYKIDLQTQLPKPIPKTKSVIAKLRSLQYSSSAIDTYLTCGLRFYYQYAIELSEKEEISGDVEQSDIGTVVHNILREFFALFIGETLRPENIDGKRLREIINRNFENLYGTSHFGEQFFAKRQIEKHLLEYFERIEKPHFKNSQTTIEGLEVKLSAERQGFQLVGKIDRIEKRGKKTFILDYKTGYNEKYVMINFKKLDFSNRSTWKSAIGSLQLPFYILLYSTGKQVPPEEIVSEFVFLGRKKLDEEIVTTLFATEEDAKLYFPEIEKIIFSLLNEILNTNIPFSPTDDVKTDCPSCPYNILCGTQWA